MSELKERVFDLLYSKNRPEDAVLQLNRILKGTPENSEALALKAYALNKLANVHKAWEFSSEALKIANWALELNPNDHIALTSKGWALIDLGRPEESLQVLRAAVRINPNNEYAWFNLAWAQYLTGDPTGSKESISKALQVSPGNRIILRGKRMMEEGSIPAHLRPRT